MVRFKNRWLLVSVAAEAPAPGSSWGGSSASAGATSGLPVLSPVHLPTSLNASGLVKVIRQALESSFGDAGAGACGGPLACRYYSSSTGIAIVRCARDAAKTVWAALSMVNELDGRRARITVLNCSGTIKKTQLRAIELDKQAILSLRQHKAAAERAAGKERDQALFARFQGGGDPDHKDDSASAGKAEAAAGEAPAHAKKRKRADGGAEVDGQGGSAAKRAATGAKAAADAAPLDDETKAALDASAKAIMALQS